MGRSGSGMIANTFRRVLLREGHSRTGVRREHARVVPVVCPIEQPLAVSDGQLRHSHLAPTWDVAGQEAARNTLIRKGLWLKST